MPITGALAAKNGAAAAVIAMEKLHFASRVRIKFPPRILQLPIFRYFECQRKYDLDCIFMHRKRIRSEDTEYKTNSNRVQTGCGSHI
jgi:hypothetical protein